MSASLQNLVTGILQIFEEMQNTTKSRFKILVEQLIKLYLNINESAHNYIGQLLTYIEKHDLITRFCSSIM
jgi:hypothetical protein